MSDELNGPCGIACPKCGADASCVTDSRVSERNSAKRRRRKCGVCDARYTTYEVLDDRMGAMMRVEKTIQSMRAALENALSDIKRLG